MTETKTTTCWTITGEGNKVYRVGNPEKNKSCVVSLKDQTTIAEIPFRLKKAGFNDIEKEKIWKRLLEMEEKENETKTADRPEAESSKMNPEQEQQLKTRFDFHLKQGRFSQWSFSCKHCGNSVITDSLKEKPGFCECRKNDYGKPSLTKILKPRIGLYPEVEKILQDPMPFVLEELKQHFQGEEQAAKTIFLVSCMAKVKNAQPTSANLLVNSESGAGKDFIVNPILGLWDNNFAIMRSRISPTALNYWHDAREEPEWTWTGKTLFLADISNSVLNSDSFKAMASGQNTCTITEKSKAVDLQIEGKPAMILTSASPSPKQELLRRFPVITLDETASQTRAILRFHGKRANKKSKIEYNQTIRLALDYLEETNVMVSFSEVLSEKFPDALIARTAFPRFLDLIKASAALHQRNRKTETIESEKYIVAEQADYELASECFLSTCSNLALIPLNAQQKKMLAFFAENKDKQYRFSSLKGIPLFAAISDKRLRIQLGKLVGYKLLGIELIEAEAGSLMRQVQHYSFKAFGNIRLPSWEELSQNDSVETGGEKN